MSKDEVTISCAPSPEEEAIRKEMMEIHLQLKPLKAEVAHLETKFIKLWNKKLELERQRVPIVKIPMKKPAPAKEEPMTPERFLSLLEALSPEEKKLALLGLAKATQGD